MCRVGRLASEAMADGRQEFGLEESLEHGLSRHQEQGLDESPELGLVGSKELKGHSLGDPRYGTARVQ